MPAEAVRLIPIDSVTPAAHQARVRFDEAALGELAASIREQGLLQPILVRPTGDGAYELVAGERRWRACRLLGMAEIPALVRAYADPAAVEAGLVENLQRADITAVEEAHAYRQLVERFGYSHGMIADRTGRHRASIANTLRLLQLPGEVLDLLHQGEISEGHARALLALPDDADRVEMAGWIARNAVSVRDAERKVQELLAGAPPAQEPPARVADPHVRALEDRLRRQLGTRVTVDYRRGRGALRVEFYSDEDLERLLDLLAPGA